MIQVRALSARDAPAVHSLLGEPEVAVWTVAPPRWGEGIATRMGEHALAGAASVGLDTVIAYTRVDTAASRRVMDKLGLVYEREFEHAGRPHVLYRT